MRIYRWVRFILIPVIAAVMIVSVWQLIRINREYRESEKAYQQVGEQFIMIVDAEEPGIASVPYAETADPSGGSIENAPLPAATQAPTGDDSNEAGTVEPAAQTPAPTETAPIAIDFHGLLNMNDECVGWIYIPDTTINYPVMQATNNSKYLNMLPDGSENKAGSIFMDSRNDPELIDGNIILYGHRLENGAMFTPLKQYEKQSFFDSHRTIWFLTPDANYKITVIGCVTVPSTGETYEMYDEPESLKEYLSDVLKNAYARASFDLKSVRQIYTLSTCTGKFGTRTVVIGIPERIG